MVPFAGLLLLLAIDHGQAAVTTIGFCKGQLSGLYSDPTDCQKYIHCSNGLTHRGRCPPRTLFSSKSLMCDWASTMPANCASRSLEKNRLTECCNCHEDSSDIIEAESAVLRPEDVKAIQKSFQLVAASASVQDLGIGFFRLLFTTHPSWLKKYFAPKFGDNPLNEFLENARFKVHAGGVISQLGEWVGLLKDKEALKTSLQESARRHGGRGIGTKQYKDIVGVLLVYLKQGLGPSLTPEMLSGWNRFMSTLVEIVSAELDPLSVKEVKAVQESFKLVGKLGTLPDIGTGFFKLLFTRFPDWKDKYFYHFGTAPLEEFLLSPKFRAHAGGVVSQIGYWVSNLETPDILVEAIKSNARNHRARGLTSQHYKDLSDVLLSYVAAGLGESLSPEMASSWTKLLDTMVAIVAGEETGDVDDGLRESVLVEADIKAVEESFELLRNSASYKDLGIGFFKKLIGAYPEWVEKHLQPNFGGKSSDELLKLPRFEGHAAGVIFKLSELVGNLKDREAFSASVRGNTRNHHKRGLVVDSWVKISGVMVSHISSQLGLAMTREMLIGWTHFMEVLVNIVEEELQAGGAKGPLTEEDVKAIENSFAQVAALGSTKDLGIGFFRLLFTTYPEWLEQYFVPVFGDKPLEEFLRIPRFEVHAPGVISELGKWVKSLCDLESLVAAIQENARNHYRRGLTVDHYQKISGVLLAYISAGLGDSLTPKMEKAWIKFLDTMVNVVNEEMDHLAKGI